MIGTGAGRKTSEEAMTISREKMRRAQVPGGGKERRSSKGVRGNNEGTWASVGKGREASRRISRFPSQTTGWK